MPCARCGSLLLYLDANDKRCPKCDGLVVLVSRTAIKVADRLVKLTTRIFNEELCKWERDALLGILSAREKYSRENSSESIRQ